jgi:hypothetical protein
MAQRTWCMISFKTSTGRSSSFSGPRAAFSFPFGAWLPAAGAADAPTALGTASWLGQTASACFGVAIACASSGADASDWAMSSSNVDGDDALGLPGVESGEAMSLSSGWDHVMGGREWSARIGGRVPGQLHLTSAAVVRALCEE